MSRRLRIAFAALVLCGALVGGRAGAPGERRRRVGRGGRGVHRRRRPRLRLPRAPLAGHRQGRRRGARPARPRRPLQGQRLRARRLPSAHAPHRPRGGRGRRHHGLRRRRPALRRGLLPRRHRSRDGQARGRRRRPPSGDRVRAAAREGRPLGRHHQLRARDGPRLHGRHGPADRRVAEGLRRAARRRGSGAAATAACSWRTTRRRASPAAARCVRSEPLYPCTAVARRYKAQCYERQSTYALFVSDGDFARCSRLCAGTERAFRGACRARPRRRRRRRDQARRAPRASRPARAGGCACSARAPAPARSASRARSA